jgi:SAM-dependent methyltransferase
MRHYSIIRSHEYTLLQKIELKGSILDIGGGARTKYHELIQGEHTFHTMNINPDCDPDTLADIEKPFPFTDGLFDHAICLNVLEHVYEFEHVVRETVRCIKPGGSLVIATPFMHHIHASPDDYLRFTESAFLRMAEKTGCKITTLEPLGFGFFSLGFQCLGIGLPAMVRVVLKPIAIGLDKMFNRISSQYRKLTAILPLGYCVVLEKE